MIRVLYCFLLTQLQCCCHLIPFVADCGKEDLHDYIMYKLPFIAMASVNKQHNGKRITTHV